MNARARLTSDSGYSLIELLVSSAIMLTVVGAIFSLVNPAQGTSQAQPEVSDLQQRMRVGTDELFKDLVMAGAGLYQGQVTGSLAQFLAPVMPRRISYLANEPMYRPDAISLSFVPGTFSQTTISSP
ncbi:MAG TPA: prepilin-type N-terminal cleavage/methylation domain-containing protein, partial [Vicinamibacterales bacterium]|nr:prepilin-type N-terminal cleavage/methylation domain-containing protein [Vicinamibacterales bacterium]